MNSQFTGGPDTTRLDVSRGTGMMGSEAALRKILVTVLASMSTDVPAIAAALQAGDVATANRMLHAIKGYMPIFGSDAMVNQVTEVEKLSKTGTAEAVQLQYQALEPQLRHLLAEIDVFLNPDQ